MQNNTENTKQYRTMLENVKKYKKNPNCNGCNGARVRHFPEPENFLTVKQGEFRRPTCLKSANRSTDSTDTRFFRTRRASNDCTEDPLKNNVRVHAGHANAVLTKPFVQQNTKSCKKRACVGCGAQFANMQMLLKERLS